ncbi:hypothetical protein XpiCFBP4643_21675 [Xanthomonas pisi]|uniref:Uncharacterized protein n=1 Tax=Xanthomonas pisi TaxID=56457 RepID=A0A2S7CTG1_9XANT|nr:hypothetical protein XpiCFBP4643_21675 [Xanthomonas pisi]
MGPYAAWMPHKSLHGRTCGVSHAGTRASALSERLAACPRWQACMRPRRALFTDWLRLVPSPQPLSRRRGA